MRVRQSIMKEFWLSFSFICFLITNSFKFMCQFMCMYILGHFTFKILGQVLFLRFNVCFFTQKYCYLFISFFISITINFSIISVITVIIISPLSANPIKWSNTLKQFIGNLPTNFLSVFDHFVKLALKGLNIL